MAGRFTVPAGGSAGKTIGRYANRIARGDLPLDGMTYSLLTNEGPNTLHGGPDGFSKRDWTFARDDDAFVEFLLHSPDGDQGFPGARNAGYAIHGTIDDALRTGFQPRPINRRPSIYQPRVLQPARKSDDRSTS